jgi:hypothetical protein
MRGGSAEPITIANEIHLMYGLERCVASSYCFWLVILEKGGSDMMTCWKILACAGAEALSESQGEQP